VPHDDLQAEVFEMSDTFDPYKLLLVDAVCGVGFPSVVLAQECEQAGMATYDPYEKGDPRWQWNRRALHVCSVEQLQELYQGLCEERVRMLSQTEELEEPQSIILQ
jgi:hypothetical protein